MKLSISMDKICKNLHKDIIKNIINPLNRKFMTNEASGSITSQYNIIEDTYQFRMGVLGRFIVLEGKPINNICAIKLNSTELQSVMDFLWKSAVRPTQMRDNKSND